MDLEPEANRGKQPPLALGWTGFYQSAAFHAD